MFGLLVNEIMRLRKAVEANTKAVDATEKALLEVKYPALQCASGRPSDLPSGGVRGNFAIAHFRLR